MLKNVLTVESLCGIEPQSLINENLNEDLLQLQQFPVLVCEIYKLKSDYTDKFLSKCNIMKFYYSKVWFSLTEKAKSYQKFSVQTRLKKVTWPPKRYK